ncbi:MAG: creatininase family protein [Candidatus Saliniplasma sp.]
MNGSIRYFNEMHMDDFSNSDELMFFLPIGISEGHGKHLPVGTDTYQAEYVVERVAEKIDKKSVIGPVLNYGHCRATSNLPGTLSISFDSLRSIVYDILKGVCKNGFEKIIVISGHAGTTHMTALKLASKKIIEEFDVKIMLLSDYELAYELKGEKVSENDGHGGEIETSRMMDIRSQLVDEDRDSADVEYPRFLIIKDYNEYLSQGMRGNAQEASAEEGREINDYVIDGIIEKINEYFF